MTILVVWLPKLGGVDVDIAAHENDFQGSIEVASHPSPRTIFKDLLKWHLIHLLMLSCMKLLYQYLPHVLRTYRVEYANRHHPTPLWKTQGVPFIVMVNLLALTMKLI